jgi:transcriptional regulator with PAS, ATPase and Fis domain
MEVLQLVEKIAPTDLPILIQGETGTGKELIARAIHQNSLRSKNKWFTTNCGALPETLLENELFGHIKGAFTDAKEDKKGYIELASEGTLFLDEISEMSSAMQQKLLRVLEEKLVWRVGAEKPIQVNTRFVFASNQNIEELVKTKKIREDLYYRINTIVITLPSLRERKEDIPLLVNHFLKITDESEVKPLQDKRSPDTHRGKEINEEVLKLLMNYNWPGNVRELENEIERICALYHGSRQITEAMLSENIKNYAFCTPSQSGNELTLKELKKLSERNIIIDALKKCNGNITKTARQLGCLRQHLQLKIRQLKIETPNNFVTKR